MNECHFNDTEAGKGEQQQDLHFNFALFNQYFTVWLKNVILDSSFKLSLVCKAYRKYDIITRNHPSASGGGGGKGGFSIILVYTKHYTVN